MLHADREIKADSSPRRLPSRPLLPAVELGLIFLVFFIHAGWPMPDVNEPHYLGKARHYWDPSWCAGDFFLNTADAHEAFYFSLGWLTQLMSLPAATWCGRILTWGLLAWAWRRLSVALVAAPLYSVLTAALWVALTDRFHMAGEWVVGGVEAKGLAYVFVLLGLEALVRNRWGWSLVAFGTASAFHVIVGGWAVVATIVAWLASRDRPPLGSLVLPALVGGVLTLGGLWPALELTWGVDRSVVDQANRLYVYDRLTHHLLPQSFPTIFIVRHLLLVVALVPLVRVAPREAPFLRLNRFIAACVGISAVGMCISVLAWWNAEWAAGLLRYYWFRMSDAMVPLGVAILSAAILFRWQRERHSWFALGLSAAMLCAAFHLGDTLWWRMRYLTPRADWPLARIDIDDWRSVCDWAAQETPEDTLFIVPLRSHTFRWYADRGEVVTRKDLPQDAKAIVEWRRRLTDIYGANDTQSSDDSLAHLGAERLRALGSEYGARYVVTRPDLSLDLPRVGPITRTVAVYDLAPAAGKAGP